MCKLAFVCIFFFCSLLQASVQSSEDTSNNISGDSYDSDVVAMASNLLEIPNGTNIPYLIHSLLNDLPIDIKAILRDKPLYELSKEQLATIPVPILYLLPSTQLYNLSGYQHGILIRLRPDILSLADLVIHSMDDPDVKIPFFKTLDYARNLSSPVQDIMGVSIAEWKSIEIQFELLYNMGNPLASHIPLNFMITMSSRLKGEMMYYLRTWLWNEFPYKGANLVKWFDQPWSIRRAFTKMSIDDNYPVNLTEWIYNHIEGFSHLIPTMTLEEFSQINLKAKYNYKYLLSAPLTVVQVRYLFNKMYPGDNQLFNVEFQEYAHLLSSLQPEQLNRFYVNATDMIQTQYSAQNMTYATAKQIAEIVKVQTIWGTDSSDFKTQKTSELSNLGSLFHTIPTAEIGKIDASQIDMGLLATVDSSKLSFSQAYELGHIKANISLSNPTYKLLPQAIPALSLADIEPKKLPSDDLLSLLRRYPGTQEAFSATLMERLRSNFGNRHMRQLLLNPNKNRLLKYLPISGNSNELYDILSELYQDPVYKPYIDQLDSALIRTIMPLKVSYKLYIKDRFLFKGVTCAHISKINTYELVVFLQDYFDYLKQTESLSTMLTKQTMYCLYDRLLNYVKTKQTSPLLNKIDNDEDSINKIDDNEVSKNNDIDQLTRHELRAFGNTVAMFDLEEIVRSKHLEAIVEMMGKSPREHLDVLKKREEYEIMLEKYLQKILVNTSDVIETKQLLMIGNLTHYLSNNLIAKIDAKGFKYFLEAKLIDTRLCGNATYRQQIGELIIRAFGHLSTWSSDILVTLQDFLMALSEDQLNQIPTKSWSDMADLIVTNYDAPANDENGLVSPFHQICTSHLRKEDAQDYIKSLSSFVKFYLIQIQTHLNTIKSAKEIMEQNLASPMLTIDNPTKVLKPATIDDDEMNRFTIFEPESSEDNYEETSTSQSTTTIEIDTEETTEDKIVTTDHTKVNESETTYWNIYLKPTISTNKEDVKESETSRPTTKIDTTTVGVKEEGFVTTTVLENNVKPSSRENKDIERDDEIDESLVSSEEDDAFHDEFESSEEKPIEPLKKSAEIIELDDSKLNISDLEGKHEKVSPCSDGSCTPTYFTSKNNGPNDTSVQKTNDIVESATVRIEITNNATENGITESDAIVDQVMDFSSSEYKTSEAGNVFTTTITETNKIVQENENSTFTPNREDNNNIEFQTKNVKGNESESDQNREIVVNELNKWNQNHENKENNEVQPLNIPENVRPKKETRLENIIPSEHTTTTAMDMIGGVTTTLHPETINQMISKLPSVPQEEPTSRSNESQIEDGYIIKPEDREIMDRKNNLTEEMANEITFSDIVSSTPENAEDFNRIPTEQDQTFTEETSQDKISENSFDNENVNSETTTTITNKRLETTTEQYQFNRIIEHNADYNQLEESIEQSSNEDENSSRNNNGKTKLKNSYQNQRQNKLTDDLSNESNHYENRYRDHDENQSTFDEEPNYYPDNQSRERNFDEPLDEFSDNIERNHEESETSKHYHGKYQYSEENHDNLDQMGTINEEETKSELENHYSNKEKSEDSNTVTDSSETREINTNTSPTNNESNKMNQGSVTEGNNAYEETINNETTTKKNKDYNDNNEDNEHNKNQEEERVTKTSNNENNEMNEEYVTEGNNNTENEETITNEPTTRKNNNYNDNNEDNEHDKNQEENVTKTKHEIEDYQINTETPSSTTTNHDYSENNNEDNVNNEMHEEEDNEHNKNEGAENITKLQNETEDNQINTETPPSTATSHDISENNKEDNVNNEMHEEETIKEIEEESISKKPTNDKESTEIIDIENEETSTKKSTNNNANFQNYESKENIGMKAEETTTAKNKHEETTTNESTTSLDYSEKNGEDNENIEQKEESEKEKKTNTEIIKQTTTTNYDFNENKNEVNKNLHMKEEETTAETIHEDNKLDQSSSNNNSTNNEHNEDINEEINLEENEKESDKVSINQEDEIIISSYEHIDDLGNETNYGPEKVNINATTLETSTETTTQMPNNNKNDTKSLSKEQQSFEKEDDEENNSDNMSDVHENDKIMSESPHNVTEETTTFNSDYTTIATTTEIKGYELKSNRVLDQDEASVTLKMETTTHIIETAELETTLKITTELGLPEIMRTTEYVKTKLRDISLSMRDFIPQTIKLDTSNAINISHDKVAFRSKKDDEFVVYDPDDSTSETIGDSSETSHTDNHVLVNSPEIREKRYDPKERVSQLSAAFQTLEKDLKLYAVDYTDEAVPPKIKSRKRRFVYTSDAHMPPTEMNITCQALNILGTITNVVSIEDIIVKLNKDNLLDCLDVIHKMKVSRRAKEAIINKYYNNMNEVLPILGNIIADLTLEEIRGIEMNAWSLEILEHANAINDTQKAQLLLDNYMKYRNTKKLNLNELVLLKNMLCYIPEDILKNSLSNLNPSQLTSILKHIDSCSTKCLHKLSAYVIKTLGTPMSWRYDQVYNLGTVPSGLNETLWNEFVQQKKLKFNINAKNFKCFDEKQVVMIQNAGQIEKKAKNNQELKRLEELQDSSSGTNQISGSLNVVIILLASYFVKSSSC